MKTVQSFHAVPGATPGLGHSGRDEHCVPGTGSSLPRGSTHTGRHSPSCWDLLSHIDTVLPRAVWLPSSTLRRIASQGLSPRMDKPLPGLWLALHSIPAQLSRTESPVESLVSHGTYVGTMSFRNLPRRGCQQGTGTSHHGTRKLQIKP